MMFLDTTTSITWMGNNKSYYENKGYVFTHFFDSFEVAITDLHPGSKTLVRCKCDFCGAIFVKSFKKIQTIKHSCGQKACRSLLRQTTCMEKYHVPYALQSKEVQERGKKTMQAKYGCDRPLQHPMFVEKAKNTYQTHYGNSNNQQALQQKRQKTLLLRTGYAHALQNPLSKEKARQTSLKRYNVPYACQNDAVRKKLSISLLQAHAERNEDIQAKRRTTCLTTYHCDHVMKDDKIKAKNSASNKIKTMIRRYGVTYPTQNAKLMRIIKRKAIQSMYNHGTAPSSQQQRYLCQLLNGKLNVPLDTCSLDIVIDNNIVIEYDGGGHDLSVKLGQIAIEDFKRKEQRRERYIYGNGYKLIRYKTTKDVLFRDKELLTLFQTCIDYLHNTSHHWIHIDVDNLIIKTSTFTIKLDPEGHILDALPTIN